MIMASKSPKPKGGKQGNCVFCEQGDICQETHGKLLSKAGVTAHYFCMLFSSGLSQNGKSEKQGILGFLQSDILKEVKRGSRLRCSYCRKGGATIGCVIRNCKKMFHLGCGRTNNTLHQFFGTFSSFCPTHRVQQDVPSDDDPSIVCSICMNTVTAAPTYDTIRAPCCRKYWYHRGCVQRYATSAGLYFFKCPLCNNKDEFQDEMLTMGIYIPDQDASWEKEPHAFQELLERYSHCDAPVCKCVEGRKYDKEGSKWEIILCDFCGSHGAHVACNHLEKLGKHDICHDCKEVDEKTREEEYLLHSPPHKRKSLELLQLELASSPDPSKGASPYPGPSDSLKKVGLPSPQRGLSPRQSVSAKNKSAVKRGKRLASPDSSVSPVKSKKQKLYKRKSAIVTSKVAKGRRTAESFLSPNTSSQSSDDSSSDDNLPFCLLKTKLSKMALESAWDVRRRKRMEYQKKNAKKKGKGRNDVNESDSEIDVKKKVVNKKIRHLSNFDSDTDTATEGITRKPKKGKGSKIKKSNSNADRNNVIKSDSETAAGTAATDSMKSKARLSLADTVSEKEIKEEKEKVRQPRMSLDILTSASAGSNEKMKQGKSKKRSLENDRTQTTLTSWLKQKPKNEMAEGYLPEPATVNTTQDKKKPVVIEWKGKQLIIKSPKVVLNRGRSRNALKMRPKNLEIDMNGVRGHSDWNRDIDLLSNLETDVRVTRKMVDIDQHDIKIEKSIKSVGSPVRSHQKQGKPENTSPVKKSKSMEHSVKNSSVPELNNNEVLNIIENEDSGKAVLPVEGRPDNEIPTEFENKSEPVIDRLNTQLQNKSEDSPAKNLRVRKTREDNSNAVLTDSEIASAVNVLKEFAFRNSPRKNTVNSKAVLQFSPKSSAVRADSPAKNLRQRLKKNDKKGNMLEINVTNFENLEKENEHTPTAEKKNCFSFTVVKDKKLCEDDPLPPETGSPLIRVKESTEWGSLILRNDADLNAQPTTELNKTTDTIERLKMYKPQVPLTGNSEDSPAKNLRKRNNQINKDPDANVCTEGDRVKDSDMDNSNVSNQLERLKKYKPRFKYLSQNEWTDLKAKNSEKDENRLSDTVKEKEVVVEMPKTTRETNEVPDVPKQPSIIWHFEGTKQLEENMSSQSDFPIGGCENTCPNPQPIVNGAKLVQEEEAKTNSPRRKSLSLDDILEERLAEIDNRFPSAVPDLDTPDELCNTAVSLSPSYFTKFRRSCSRSESLESFSSKVPGYKITIENGSIVTKDPLPEKGNPALDVPQTRRNLLDAVRNKTVGKLRSSPKPKKQVSVQPEQTHMSDKFSMAEYYGTSLQTEQLQKKSSVNNVTVDNNNDTGELSVLIIPPL